MIYIIYICFELLEKGGYDVPYNLNGIRILPKKHEKEDQKILESCENMLIFHVKI